MQELFSNEFFQLSLEKLNWIHQERGSRAWEFITFVEIEEESKFFAMMLKSLSKPIQLGDYKYYLAGSNRIERQSPKIKIKTKLFDKFKLSSPSTIKIKKTEQKGLVTKIV